MSSNPEKTSNPHFTFSLATRLTAWYAATAFAISLFTITVLYLSLENRLLRQSDRAMLERLRDLRSAIQENRGTLNSLAPRLEEQASSGRLLPLFLRIDAPDTSVQASGFDRLVAGLPMPDPRALEDQPAILSSDGQDNIPLRLTAIRLPGESSNGPYTVRAAMDISAQKRLLSDFRRWLWVAIAGVLVLSVLGGFQIARRGIHPINEITATAQRVGSTRLDQRIETQSMPTEVARVAWEFNLMLDRLQDAFDRLNRFSADIAHELRNPVNNMRGALELVLSRPRSQKEYRETIESASEDLERLIRIIESLLFLARAEDTRHQVEKERLNLAHELQVVREFYEAASSEAKVELKVEAPVPVFCGINRTLFQRAIGNLMQNALIHTPAGGDIVLRVSAADAHAIVEVQDSGTGVSPEHLPKLCDRLYRVDADRSKKLGGAGLGLAIVKSIVESHRGSIALWSLPGRGMKATLRFPLE